jgi:hypothetical protein
MKCYRPVKPLYHFADIFQPEFQKEQRYIGAAFVNHHIRDALIGGSVRFSAGHRGQAGILPGLLFPGDSPGRQTGADLCR